MPQVDKAHPKTAQVQDLYGKLYCKNFYKKYFDQDKRLVINRIDLTKKSTNEKE
jgi:hypothetical protein